MLIGCKAKFIQCVSGSNNDRSWCRVLLEDPKNTADRFTLYADSSLTNRFRTFTVGDELTLYLNLFEGRQGIRVVIQDVK